MNHYVRSVLQDIATNLNIPFSELIKEHVMEFPVGGYELGKIMADLGMLPEEVADIKLKIPADGLLQLVYTVNLLPTGVQKLAIAFQKLHEEIEKKEIEQKRIANAMGDGLTP